MEGANGRAPKVEVKERFLLIAGILLTATMFTGVATLAPTNALATTSMDAVGEEQTVA